MHALFFKQKPVKELNMKLAQKYILLQKTNEKNVCLRVQIRQEIISTFLTIRLTVEPESSRWKSPPELPLPSRVQ